MGYTSEVTKILSAKQGIDNIQLGFYVEQNPVRKDYVRESKNWVYSSANKDESLLDLDSIYE